MPKYQAVELTVYGTIVAILSWMVYQSAPGMGRNAYLVGFTGGMLSVVWGVLSLLGFRRVWPVLLTLIPVAFVCLAEAVHLWMAEDVPGGGRRLAAALATIVFALTTAVVGHVSYVAQQPATGVRDV
jgi:hypothetical protein